MSPWCGSTYDFLGFLHQTAKSRAHVLWITLFVPGNPVQNPPCGPGINGPRPDWVGGKASPLWMNTSQSLAGRYLLLTLSILPPSWIAYSCSLSGTTSVHPVWWSAFASFFPTTKPITTPLRRASQQGETATAILPTVSAHPPGRVTAFWAYMDPAPSTSLGLVSPPSLGGSDGGVCWLLQGILSVLWMLQALQKSQL